MKIIAKKTMKNYEKEQQENIENNRNNLLDSNSDYID